MVIEEGAVSAAVSAPFMENTYGKTDPEGNGSEEKEITENGSGSALMERT